MALIEAKRKEIQLHPADNVRVALTDLPKGDLITINEHTIVLQDFNKAKHKFFIHSLNAGDSVIMYGVLVGTAQTKRVVGAG